VGFVEQQRQAGGFTHVGLVLFGGEPLLNPALCYEILESIEHMGHASIITNGIRLTPDVAWGLATRGVKSVQITFDGAQPDHDNARVLAANGGGTYHTIVENLAQLNDLAVFPDRQIRVNVTASNLARIPELLEDLASRLNPQRWSIGFALVNDNGIGWDNVLQAGTTADQALATCMRQAKQLGFTIPYLPQDVPACSFCTTPFGTGGIVVGPDGNLYSCLETVGFADMRVGSVYKGFMDPVEGADRWKRCGYKSCNQPQAKPALTEVDWTSYELAVMSTS
jgi:uncharacterized protein